VLLNGLRTDHVWEMYFLNFRMPFTFTRVQG
jgi:hypothetical protein